MGFRASPYKRTGAVTITGSQTVAGPVTIADDNDASTIDALYLRSEISEPDAPADGEGGVLYVKSDGIVYWKSYEYGETDLTLAGGGSGAGIAMDGSTGNGILTRKSALTASVEQNFKFDGVTNILSVTGQVSASLGITASAYYSSGDTFDLKSNGTQPSEIRLYCETGNAHYTAIRGPVHSGAESYILKVPNTPPTDNQILKVSGTPSGTPKVVALAWEEDGGSAGGGGSGTVSSSYNNYVSFYTGSAGSTTGVTGSSNLYWDNDNSRLGIGLTSPEYALQVNGALGITGSIPKIYGSSTDEYIMLSNENGVHLSAGDTKASIAIGNTLTLKTNGNSQLTINALDYPQVGIGNAAPQATLEVKNSGSSKTLKVWSTSDNDSFTILSDGKAGLGTDAPVSSFHIAQPSDVNTGGMQIYNAAGNDNFVFWVDGSTRKIDVGSTNAISIDDAGACTFAQGISVGDLTNQVLSGSTVLTGSDNSTIFGVHSDSNAGILTITGSGEVIINSTGSSTHGGWINDPAALTVQALATDEAIKIIAPDDYIAALLKVNGDHEGELVLNRGGSPHHHLTPALVVFNDRGIDADFRVETDNQTHTLFIHGENDRVGISTSAPSHTFTAEGDSAITSGSLTINSRTEFTGSSVSLASTSKTIIDTYSTSTTNMAKYTIHGIDNTNSDREVAEVILYHSGSEAHTTRTFTDYTGTTSFMAFSGSVSGGDTRLHVTCTNNNNTITIMRNSLLA